MRQWFAAAVLARPWAAFLVMGLAFFGFGIGTVNLFMLLAGNLRLLGDHGWQAAMDGALQQLAELLLSGYVAMAAYAVFKSCEHSLVRYLTRETAVTPGAASGTCDPPAGPTRSGSGNGRPSQ
jgi:hypothetical protein